MKLLKRVVSKAPDRQSGQKGSASSRLVRNNLAIRQRDDGGDNVTKGEANAVYQGHRAEVGVPQVSPERMDTASRAAMFSSSSDDDHDENTALRAMQESDGLIALPASSSLRSSVHHSVRNHERAETFPTFSFSHHNRSRHEIATLDISDSSEEDLEPPLHLVNTPRSTLRKLRSPTAHARAHACAKSHFSASDGHAKTENTSFPDDITDSEDDSSSEGKATGQHRALRQGGLLASPLPHFDHGARVSADGRFAR
jgi:hypothetical protein